MSLEGKGRQPDKLNPQWIVLVRFSGNCKSPYANPVGRTIFQKIAHVLTEMGVQTNFRFGKGTCRPVRRGMKAACTSWQTATGCKSGNWDE
jgi:hypothetical protein